MRHTGSCQGATRSFITALSKSTLKAPHPLAKQQLRPAVGAAAVSSSGLSDVSAATPTASTRAVSTSISRPNPVRLPCAGFLRRKRGHQGEQRESSRRSRSSSSSLPDEEGLQRAPVVSGIVSPRRTVPDHIPKTPYYATGAVPPQDNHIHLHTAETLVPMREACILARDVLDLCCELAQPGVTTDAIDAAVHAAIIEAGACPSPLNYHGFPKSVCSSVNEVACHAIPDDRPLQDGDLVSFDVSVFRKGFHGDNCATVGVGTIDAAGQRLIDATKEAMLEGVAVCRPGACLTEIGGAIHAVADRCGFDTVRKYCGHGVGSSFHMLPFVEHFRNNRHLEMMPGMTFTIEPIFTEGAEATTTWPDAWTVQTVDGGRAAQFEHVVLITEDGHEILTVPSSDRHR